MEVGSIVGFGVLDASGTAGTDGIRVASNAVDGSRPGFGVADPQAITPIDRKKITMTILYVFFILFCNSAIKSECGKRRAGIHALWDLGSDQIQMYLGLWLGSNNA